MRPGGAGYSDKAAQKGRNSRDWMPEKQEIGNRKS